MFETREFRLRDALVFGSTRALADPLCVLFGFACVAAGIAFGVWIAAPALADLGGAALVALDGLVPEGAIESGSLPRLAAATLSVLAGFWLGDVWTLRALTPHPGRRFPGVALARQPLIRVASVLSGWPAPLAVLSLTGIFAYRHAIAEDFAPAAITTAAGLLLAVLLHGAVGVRLRAAPAFAALSDPAPLASAWRRSATSFWTLSLAHLVVLAASCVWIVMVAAGAALVLGDRLAAVAGGLTAAPRLLEGGRTISLDLALMVGGLMGLIWVGPRLLGQGVQAWFARCSGAGQAAAAAVLASKGAR